jgi:hypothetical protein
LSLGFSVLTANLPHFQKIPGLAVMQLKRAEQRVLAHGVLLPFGCIGGHEVVAVEI